MDKAARILHQTAVKTMRIAILAALAGLAWAPAGEMRVWTSRKGTNLEAELLKVEGDSVTLVTAEAKQVKVDLEDLSLADRQYLVEYGGADKEILVGGELGVPEKDVRIDTGSFEKLDKKMALGDESELVFELLETEHFLVGYAGDVRPKPVAETAERLWHGMAFQHMNFRRDWGSKRRLVLLCEDRDVHKMLGKWHADVLAGMGAQDAAAKSQVLWDQVGATTIYLDDKHQEEWNLHPGATVFNIKDDSKSRYRKDLSPFPTHVLAGHLLRQQMGGVSDYGSEGYFAVITGHAYYKEILLTGETETNLIDAEGSGFDEITKARGFEDGTSWARTLRSMVRRSKLEPDFEAMLGWKQSELDPAKLVLIYSFAYFSQSTPERLAGFANMVRRVETSNQIPEPIEFARLFGFDSVEALQEAWVEFIKSPDFK
jgi:hypothetical protein